MSGSAGTRYYLAEWYRSELSQDEVDHISVRLDAAVADEGATVRRVMTLAVPTGEWMFTLFEAGSAEAVEEVCRRAGMVPQQLNVAVGDRSPSRDGDPIPG